MEAQVLTIKTKTAIDTFLNLNGNTYNEKKKSLNTFLKTLQSEYKLEEIQDFINNLNTTTEYDRCLKAEIIIRFQLEPSILETLKSGNEAAVGYVLKNLVFFKNLFDKMTMDDFVDNFLPQLSYKTSIKVIKVIGKNLGNNSEFADDLFNKLEQKFGIKTAMVIAHNCSLYLIKDKWAQHRLTLPSRCLLLIYKTHPSFLDYYLDIMPKQKTYRDFSISSYNQIFKYIAKTNSKLFWELYKKYRFPIKIGKRLVIKLLPTQEVMIEYGFEHHNLFNSKHIMNVALKFNLHKELIYKSFPDDLNDYIKGGINHDTTSYILYVPKKQTFPLLQELFAKKYKEDFQNYVSLMCPDFLRFITINEREYILDRLNYDKENFLHYYPINRSIPLLKEKLKSANDSTTRLKLMCALCDTCDVNNNAESLLDVLKFIYVRYKNDMNNVIDNMIRNWKDYSGFTEEHWETIYKILEYLGHSEFSYIWNHFFQRHFVWLIDNNKPHENLMDQYANRYIAQNGLGGYDYIFEHLKHMIIFIEEIHNRLPGKDHISYLNLLHVVVKFDRRFPNKINLLDYAYILEYGVKHGRNQQTGHEFYFIKYYNKDKFFNKYIKYFDHPSTIDAEIILYCLKYCPEELDNFSDIHKKMDEINKNIRNFLLCPYYVQKCIPIYNKLCLEQLEDTEKNIDSALVNFFSYDQKFIEIIPKFLPPKDTEIEPEIDNIFETKQQEIINCIPQLPTPENMKLIQIFCKTDDLQFVLAPLYKIAYSVPQNLLPEFLQNIYEAGDSVKKPALNLGRLLLPVNSYYDFLLSASELETNLPTKSILIKKTIEYFTEIVDEKFFNLFIKNLENIDKNDEDLYDYLSCYCWKIPQEFILKYITAVYNNKMSNEDEDILDKGFNFMENLPDYVMDELPIDLMKQYIKTANLNCSDFINKCLFHTTGEKHSNIYKYIMNLITDLLKKYTSTDNSFGEEITSLILNIISDAILRNNIKIIEDINTIFKGNVQRSLSRAKFHLEFSIIFLQSKKDPEKFAENIKLHLLETIETYSSTMIEVYKEALLDFTISLSYRDYFNDFLFISSLCNEGNESVIVYLIVISLLPPTSPTERDTYVLYLPILEKLKLSDDPRVITELDLYFRDTCNL